jgi:hypothetical protein
MKRLSSGRVSLLRFAAAYSMMLISISCTKPHEQEVEVVPQSDYVLREIDYFMSGSDRIDTVNLYLGDTTLLNPGDTKAAFTFLDSFEKLTKTSSFHITNESTLPADLHLGDFTVHVPSQLNPNGSFTFFSVKLPFKGDSTIVPYGSFWSDSITVNVPERSSITVSRNVNAYHLTCSFKAVVTDKTTGLTFDVNGAWKGLLRYDNLTTRLTEHPIGTM